jgi:small-conductance mechanosensitive channel
VLVLGLALAWFARFLIWKLHSIDPIRSTTERYWRSGILFAIRRALTGFFIFTAAFFACVPLLPHIGLALGNFPIFTVAANVAGLGYFATVVAFCLRLVHLVRHWLASLATRPAVPWYFAAFPVVGQALYYDVVLCALSTAINLLQLPDAWVSVGYEVASLAGILLNTAICIRAVLAIEAMMLSRSSRAKRDVYQRRRVETRIQMLRRLLVVVILIIGLGALLMTFQPVRQLGTRLLASAGVVGIIGGFAAQKSLGMIIGGLQLAITEPVRLNDEIIIEGKYGVVEEITLTYVVVRTWDERSLVVPITSFLEKPFQNWTRHSSDLIGVVFMYVDFLAPLAELRAETERIVHASERWDRRVFAFQITDFKPDCVEVRILASAINASVTFDLRCEIREQLLSFLQARYPATFRRLRTLWSPLSSDRLPETANSQASSLSFQSAH